MFPKDDDTIINSNDFVDTNVLTHEHTAQKKVEAQKEKKSPTHEVAVGVVVGS